MCRPCLCGLAVPIFGRRVCSNQSFAIPCQVQPFDTPCCSRWRTLKVKSMQCLLSLSFAIMCKFKIFPLQRHLCRPLSLWFLCCHLFGFEYTWLLCEPQVCLVCVPIGGLFYLYSISRLESQVIFFRLTVLLKHENIFQLLLCPYTYVEQKQFLQADIGRTFVF